MDSGIHNGPREPGYTHVPHISSLLSNVPSPSSTSCLPNLQALNPTERNGITLITETNPFVFLYIRGLLRWKDCGVFPPSLVGRSRPLDRNAWPISEHAWVVSVTSVNDVLGCPNKLDETECKCVLALAALGNFSFPGTPVHTVLWPDSKSVWYQTAYVVQEVVYAMNPCPIRLPLYWLGISKMRLHWVRNLRNLIPEDNLVTACKCVRTGDDDFEDSEEDTEDSEEDMKEDSGEDASVSSESG
ncbi:hypothetical protein B0H21DRAFT_712112 [Amylocystis lapponica]|nr:hypothetical protein B0H21DRAFT_712112 [Amylocystis lapponica]